MRGDTVDHTHKKVMVDLPLVLFLFCLLFSPPVIPKLNTAIFGAAVGVIFLLTRYRSQLAEMVKESGIGTFAAMMGVFFGYIGIVTAANLLLGDRVQPMHYVKLAYRFLMIVPVLMVCSLFVCLRARERKFSVFGLAMQFVWATLFQFVLVLGALVIPELKQYFISVIYRNTGDSYLGIPWVMARRGFGFTNSFVDSFGFGMGIVGALPLYFVKERRLWILLTVPCLAMVSFVNVRTGIVIGVMGAVIALPLLVRAFLELRGSEKGRMALVLLLTFVLFALFACLVWVCNPLTVHWVLGDFGDLLGLDLQLELPTQPSQAVTVPPGIYTDSQTTTAEQLFSDRFWNLPKGFGVLFGTGHTVYGAEGYPHSDVGYVNDLWLGGVIGCVLLYGAFGLLFVRAFRASRRLNLKALILFMAVSMGVFQIKANAIMFNAGINTILPLLFYICHRGESEDEVWQMKSGSA